MLYAPETLLHVDFEKAEIYMLASLMKKHKYFYPCAKDYQDLENHLVISAHDNVEVKYALSKYLGTDFYYCPEGCSMIEDWIYYGMEKNNVKL